MQVELDFALLLMNFELAYELILHLMDYELSVVLWLAINVESLFALMVEMYGCMVEMKVESLVGSMVEINADNLAEKEELMS